MHLRVAVGAAQQRLGARRTGVRWARITRSSPSDRLIGNGGMRSATAISAPLDRPEPLGQPAHPALGRERAHERDVGGDHEAARGDQLAQRAPRQQDGVRGQVAPPARAGELARSATTGPA